MNLGTIVSNQTRRILRGRGPSSQSGVWSVMLTTRTPATVRPFTHVIRPGPRPLTCTRTVWIPLLTSRCPAATPVVWPAIVVFLRAFLNPSKRHEVDVMISFYNSVISFVYVSSTTYFIVHDSDQRVVFAGTDVHHRQFMVGHPVKLLLHCLGGREPGIYRRGVHCGLGPCPNGSFHSLYLMRLDLGSLMGVTDTAANKDRSLDTADLLYREHWRLGCRLETQSTQVTDQAAKCHLKLIRWKTWKHYKNKSIWVQTIGRND